VTCQPLLNEGFAVVRDADQTPLDRPADHRLEGDTGFDRDPGATIEQLHAAGVAQLEPVVGIVEGEPLKDALYGVDQALAGGGELMRALVDLVLQAGVKLLKPGGRSVESIGQRVELVAGPDLDPSGEVTAADPGRLLLQTVGRAGHASRQYEPDEAGEAHPCQQQTAGP
jgi:hypothetical protein